MCAGCLGPAVGEEFFLALAAEGFDDLLHLHGLDDLHAPVSKMLGLPTMREPTSEA